jgi:hypothetical protein
MASYEDRYHYYVKSGICFSEDGAVKWTKEKVAAQRSAKASDCFGSEWIGFGPSGRLISAADTPHRLSEHLKVDWLLLD